MPNIIQSIKNLSSPATEAKIKNATNIEPLGPYNHELIELARLTFNKKDSSVIISGIIKRLNPVVKIATNKKRQTEIDNPFASKRAVSLPSFHFKQESSLSHRSNTFALFTGKEKHHSDLDEKTSLSVLKTCAVILYLLQNGSEYFIDWMQKEYHIYIKPLLKLSYPSKYHETLRYKLQKIINFMESPEDLQNNRNNIHKLRADVMTPGVKRSSIDIDLLHVQQQQSPIRDRRSSFDQMYTLSSSPPSSIGINNNPRSSFSEFPKRRYSSTEKSTLLPTQQEEEHPPTSSRTPNPHRLSSIF